MTAAVVASLLLFGVWLHETRRNRPVDVAAAVTVAVRGFVKAARILTGGAR